MKYVIAKHVSLNPRNLAHDLWVYNSNCSAGNPAEYPKNLTNVGSSGQDFRFPDIHPDGKRVIAAGLTNYAAPGETASWGWDLYLLNIDGGPAVQLTNTQYFSEYWPSWSGDGNSVAFGGSWASGHIPDGDHGYYNIYVLRDLFKDCDDDSVPDSCELDSSSLFMCGGICALPGNNCDRGDCNNNSIPDDCETDTDSDGKIDVCDGCVDDPLKTNPGACGCGKPETDSDNDSTPNCIDGCPDDPLKTSPGVCGCGVADADVNGNGIPDCNDAPTPVPTEQPTAEPTLQPTTGPGVTPTSQDPQILSVRPKKPKLSLKKKVVTVKMTAMAGVKYVVKYSFLTGKKKTDSRVKPKTKTSNKAQVTIKVAKGKKFIIASYHYTLLAVAGANSKESAQTKLRIK